MPGETNWSGSPFAWMKGIAPTTTGAIGKEIVKAVALARRSIVREGGAGCDLILDDDRVEVRTSLRWRAGDLSFAQLRDEKYDSIAMLGIEPFRVRIWCVPKVICMALPNQHGKETHWLRFSADEPPLWLADHLELDTDDRVVELRLFA